MAARKNRVHPNDKCREKIKTGMLLKKLADHVVGVEELSNTQIKAAEILLKKTLPDLKQMEHVGNENNPIRHAHKWTIEVCSADTTDT